MEKVFNLGPPAMRIESMERLDVLLKVFLTKGCSQTLGLVTKLVIKTGLPRQKGSLSTFNEVPLLTTDRAITHRHNDKRRNRFLKHKRVK